MRMRALTGSRARAGIITALFGDGGGHQPVSELAKAAGVQYAAAHRAVRRLERVGLIRRAAHVEREIGPLYEADPTFPGYVELRRFVLASTGYAIQIRTALAAIDPRQLAWICGRYAEARHVPLSVPIAIVSITGEAQAIRARVSALAAELHRGLAVVAMSEHEWSYRLERREMKVLAIRRAQRLWLLGDNELLTLCERGAIEARRARKAAIANWREELSDEWDETYDPFSPALRTW